MRRGLPAYLYALAVLTVLTLLPSLAARAEIVFPEGETGQIAQYYLEYTAGQPLTLKVDAPHYSTTGNPLRYEWQYDDYTGGDPVITTIAITSEPSYTLTPPASDHLRMLHVMITEEGAGEDGDGYCFDHILLDRAQPYPQLPKETGERWREYELCLGESVTLTLPEATARDSGKTLEYRWYSDWPDGGNQLHQVTSSPTLTVANDGTYDPKEIFWLGFHCEVGYQGEEDTFLRYAPYFNVSFYAFTDFRVTAQEKPVVPDAAREKLNINTVTELELYLFEKTKKEEPSLKDETASYRLYEVTLQIFDGQNWVAATPENFPEGGIPVTLPYPEGIDSWNYDFTVAHMFSQDISYHKAGEVEYPEAVKTSGGLRVWLDGVSPVLLTWQRSAGAPPVDAPQAPAVVPKTGDATPLGALAALLVLSACGMAALTYTSRKRRI